jgi:hypothetical protein
MLFKMKTLLVTLKNRLRPTRPLNQYSNQTSRDKRWQIYWRTGRASWSYSESETNHEITVVNTATQEVVATFFRTVSGSVRGWENEGLHAIRFARSSRAILVEYENGKHERITLVETSNIAVRCWQAIKRLIGACLPK